MNTRVFHITPTAARNPEQIAEDTAGQWGVGQAHKYLAELYAGFQYMADNPAMFPKRKEMAGKTDFLLHRIRHHYIIFKPIAPEAIAILAVIHEKMNVPARLAELKSKTSHEIEMIKSTFPPVKTYL